MPATTMLSRRRLLGASFGVAALGALACSRAPTSNAPSLAATAAAQPITSGRPGAAGTREASATPAPPSPTPTLVPPRPTVTPTPIPPTPTPVVIGQPQQVDIARIGVAAPIIPIKTTPRGDLDAPDRPEVVGWFLGGPRPGDPGNALLTGHLDWAGPPPRQGVFWRLKEINAGDGVVVATDKGERVAFTVEWTRLYQRNNAPVEQLLGFQLGRVLTIITCEGQFIPNERDYTERRVVRAKLTSA